MKNRSTGIMVLLFTLLSHTATADELWDRATAIAAENGTWTALNVTVTTVQRSRDGREISRGVTQIERIPRPDGTFNLLVTRDGEFPNRGNDSATDRFQSAGSPVPGMDLFSRERRRELDMRRVPPDRGGEVRYEVRPLSGEGPAAVVVLNRDSAVPRTIELTATAPPSPLDEATTTVRFNDDPRRWYPLRTETIGSVRALGVRRTVEVTVEFDNYIPEP